jgi:hypothetical protein
LEAKLPMTRHQKIRALQDADRTRGDRDRVIFAAALVTDKLLPSSNPSLADTNTTHTRFLEPLARRLRCVIPAT